VYGRSSIVIRDLENVIIEGENPETTKFLSSAASKTWGMNVVNCRNVSIRNLMLLYRQTPFCQGTVLETDIKTNSVIIRHDAGTLPPTDPCYRNAGCASRRYTPRTARLVRKQFMTFQGRLTSWGNGKYRVLYRSAVSRGEKPEGGPQAGDSDRKGMRSFQFNDCTPLQRRGYSYPEFNNAAFRHRGGAVVFVEAVQGLSPSRVVPQFQRRRN
jgi:hypothetical protein